MAQDGEDTYRSSRSTCYPVTSTRLVDDPIQLWEGETLYQYQKWRQLGTKIYYSQHLSTLQLFTILSLFANMINCIPSFMVVENLCMHFSIFGMPDLNCQERVIASRSNFNNFMSVRNKQYIYIIYLYLFMKCICVE